MFENDKILLILSILSLSMFIFTKQLFFIILSIIFLIIIFREKILSLFKENNRFTEDIKIK
ncbi:MAG: hypothetical protein QW250_06985, partial [Sulfolobaceae archaeon]